MQLRGGVYETPAVDGLYVVHYRTVGRSAKESLTELSRRASVLSLRKTCPIQRCSSWKDRGAIHPPPRSSDDEWRSSPDKQVCDEFASSPLCALSLAPQALTMLCRCYCSGPHAPRFSASMIK